MILHQVLRFYLGFHVIVKFMIEMKEDCSIHNYTNIESKKKSFEGSKIFGWFGIRFIDNE